MILRGEVCTGLKATSVHLPEAGDMAARILEGDKDSGTGSQELAGEAGKPLEKPGKPLALPAPTKALRPPSC